MSNILKFPKVKRPVPPVADEAPKKAGNPQSGATAVSDASPLVKGLWVTTVILWPVLKWIIALDCVWQFVRAMYYWNTPGTFAGMNFLLHFSAFVAVTYFVSCYKPKGL